MLDNQIARMIYHKCMSNMKYTLELEEYSYREKGRDDPKYKTFKKHLMANTYDTLRSLFESLSELGLIEKTQDSEECKGGYRETPGGGSGYINTKEIDDWLNLTE